MGKTFILLDPTISDENSLTGALRIFPKGDCRIVCFFCPQQEKTLVENGYEAICFGKEEWPYKERSKIENEILQDFDDSHRWPSESISVDNRTLSIDILKVITHGRFLKNHALPVAKTLSLLKERYSVDECCVVWRSNEYYAHVRFCLEQMNVRISREINCRSCADREPKDQFRHSLRRILTAIWMITRIKVLGHKSVLIPSGNMTDNLNGYMQARNPRLVIIRSISFVITLLQKWSGLPSCPPLQSNPFSAFLWKYPPFIQLAFNSYFEYYKQRQWPTDCRKIVAILKALDLLKPKLIFLYNWSGLGQAYFQWSRKNNVPAVSVQHGFQGKYALSYKPKVESDIYFAWYEARGVLEIDRVSNRRVKIVQSGNPLYAKIDTAGDMDTSPIQNVLVAPTGLQWLKADADWEFWLGMIELMKSEFGMRLNWRIRFHHKDRFKDYTMPALKKLRHVSIIDNQSESILSSIKQSELVVTTVSSVALDSASLRRPVIVVNHTHEPEYFSKLDGPTVVSNIEEARQTLWTLISKTHERVGTISRQSNFISRFRADDAVERIASVLQEMV
jgi:hypothetical protein